MYVVIDRIPEFLVTETHSYYWKDGEMKKKKKTKHLGHPWGWGSQQLVQGPNSLTSESLNSTYLLSLYVLIPDSGFFKKRSGCLNCFGGGGWSIASGNPTRIIWNVAESISQRKGDWGEKWCQAGKTNRCLLEICSLCRGLTMGQPLW